MDQPITKIKTIKIKIKTIKRRRRRIRRKKTIIAKKSSSLERIQINPMNSNSNGTPNIVRIM
jgi:hypothetical protein